MKGIRTCVGVKLLKCYRDSVDASASHQVAEALARLLKILLNRKSVHWCRACKTHANSNSVVPQTLVGCVKTSEIHGLIVACDPRCIMEREGSVALVCLREKAVCDLVNIVRFWDCLPGACT